MIIMDKVKTGLREGIARTIMKSRQQRGLDPGLGSGQNVNLGSTVESKQVVSANLDFAPQNYIIKW